MKLKPEEKKMERFWVSQSALIIRDNKILILCAANGSFWMFPGGRADLGETGERALARELKEELNVSDYRVLAVVDYDLWYTENRHIPVCSIANLVDIGKAEIKLSFEHSEFKWIGLAEVDQYQFFLPRAKDFIKKAFELNEKITAKQ